MLIPSSASPRWPRTDHATGSRGVVRDCSAERSLACFGTVLAPRQVSGCRNAGHPGSQRPMLVGRDHGGYEEPDGPACKGRGGFRRDVTRSWSQYCTVTRGKGVKRVEGVYLSTMLCLSSAHTAQSCTQYQSVQDRDLFFRRLRFKSFPVK